MNWKKALLCATVGVMTAVSLTGCGGSGSTSSSGDSGKPVEIEYWHVASDSFGGKTVRELVDDFNKNHPNIKVKKNLIRICIKD